MATQTLPKNHKGFIEAFRNTVSADDGTYTHDALVEKRQKVVHKSNSAVLARYTIGGDDNLYTQLGLSVLHTSNDDTRELAPGALYSADVLQSIHAAVVSNAKKELVKRRDKADGELQKVLTFLRDAFSKDDGILKTLGPPEQTLLTSSTPYAPSSDANTLKGILESLKNTLENDAILKTFVGAAPPPPPAAAAGPSAPKPSLVKKALAAQKKTVQATSALCIDHVLSRGICGHRGPHEARTDAPLDDVLTYAVNPNMARIVSMAASLRLPVEDELARSEHDDAASLEAMTALQNATSLETYATSESVVSEARQVRWLPEGPCAADIAEAAMLEHAAARCTEVAQSADNLSDEVRQSLRRMAAASKIEQLQSLYRISCAMEDGEDLMARPLQVLVTRPVARLRSQTFLAHDAGHCEAPAERVVLDASRWTADDAKSNASYRSSPDAVVGTYFAPDVSRLGFVAAPTGAGVQRSAPPMVPFGTAQIDFRRWFLDVVRYGLYYTDIPSDDTAGQVLGVSKEELGSAVSRRGGVWNEMLRDIAISTDRLWTFVRTLSGLIGEDADSLLIMADEASIAASKDIQAQRKAVADRVSAFQTKLVETLVGGMMRESGLRLDTSPEQAAESLVVINKDTAKQISDLASGESGRPFFEASVALRAITDKGSHEPKPLSEVVGQLNSVVEQIHAALDAGLASPQTAGATLGELALPRNSYFVKLREDTTAAIRSAYDKFQVECAVKGVGRISLWELIEGGDHTLCTRFAEFVGHVLVQNRTSTGVSALYASRAQLTVNASQALVSLQRLLNHAGHYRDKFSYPDFGGNHAGETAGTLTTKRDDYFVSGGGTAQTSWVDGAARFQIRAAQNRWARLGGWSSGLSY